MRHFYHLTHDDRIKIEALLKEKHTPKEIANNIGCHISTIYRELKRGRYEHRNSDWTTEERYSPDIADEKYRENLAAKGPGLKIGNDIELAEYIENKIVNEKYSPGAVLGEIKHKGITFSVTISKTTLYSYIDKGIFLHLTNKDLPVKKNEKKKYDKVRRTRAQKGDSIEKTPGSSKYKRNVRTLGNGHSSWTSGEIEKIASGINGKKNKKRNHHGIKTAYGRGSS